jgi:hypothetical protein
MTDEITQADLDELRAFAERWPTLAAHSDEIHSIWVDKADKPLRCHASVIQELFRRLDEAESDGGHSVKGAAAKWLAGDPDYVARLTPAILARYADHHKLCDCGMYEAIQEAMRRQ